MSEREAVLIDEIKQIVSQYKAEVPGQRHAWPKAVKERVAALFTLGLKPKAVASQTGLSYHTVSLWKSQSSKASRSFKPVRVIEARAESLPPKPARSKNSATVTVKEKMPPTRQAKPRQPRASTGVTVTVTTPEGFVIDHLPVESVMAWLMGGVK